MASTNPLASLLKSAAEAQTKFSTAQAEMLKDPANEDAKKAFNEASAAFVKANADLTAAAEKVESPDDQISKARKEEKTKLYDKMKESDKQVQELKAKSEEMAKKLAEITAAANPDPASNPPAPEPKPEDKGGKGEEPVLDPRVVELEKQIVISNNEMAELKKTLANKELEAYKHEQLAKSGDKLIPELVSGTTKEEIDNSIKRSQDIFQRTIKKVEAPGAAGVNNTNRGSLPTPPSPNVNPKLLSGELSADQIRKMSPEEWAKYRKDLGFKK